jgi:hypothetical protein
MRTLQAIGSMLSPGDLHLHPLTGSPVQKHCAFALRPLMRFGGGWQTLFLQDCRGFIDFVDLEAEVMQTRPVSKQPLLQWMVRRQRLDELKVRVAQVEMRQAHCSMVHHFAEQDW